MKRRSKPITRTPDDPQICPATSTSSCSSPATNPREQAAAAIETAAALGNLKACRMVAEGVPDRLRGIDPTEQDDPITPHVAAAMIAAGLVADRMSPEQAYAWISTFPEDGLQHPAGRATRPPGR